jgi:hypothetical protein
MRELINVVAECEHRKLDAVLFDLTLAPFDVIRVRSLDADAYGSIRFEHGLDLHEEAKKLVVAAAFAAASEHPRKAWKGRRPESVSQYLDRLRLGQTENSSFALNILSPYSFQPEGPPDLFQDTAFGRRVTLMFGRALEAIKVALADAVEDPIPAFEKSLGSGVSANLCQALARLADNDAGVQVSVSWSPAKPAEAPVSLNLSPQDAAVLHEVAREFARHVPEPEFVLEGLVEEIKEKPDRFDGSVMVTTQIPDQGLRKVQVRFDETYRDLVYDAAKDKKWIRVVGSLTRDAKVLKLLEPHDFEIIEFGEET